MTVVVLSGIKSSMTRDASVRALCMHCWLLRYVDEALIAADQDLCLCDTLYLPAEQPGPAHQNGQRSVTLSDLQEQSKS